MNLLLFLFSVVLPLSYLVLFLGWAEREPSVPSETSNDLRLEYETLNRTVEQRENTLLASGTIFVVASLLLLGQSISVAPRTILVLGSWVIYTIWLLFFQIGSVRFATVTYARLKWIEGKLSPKLDVHTFLRKYRIPTRRWVWFILLNALLAIGNFILYQSKLVIANLIFVLFVVAYDLIHRDGHSIDQTESNRPKN